MFTSSRLSGPDSECGRPRRVAGTRNESLPPPPTAIPTIVNVSSTSAAAATRSRVRG